MAREIVTWCDPCMGRDERTPGREETLMVGGKPRVLALCDADRDQYVKPLEALLEEFGAPAEAPGKRTTPTRIAAGNPGAEATLQMFTLTGTRKGRKPEGGRTAECMFCPLNYSGDAGLIRHLHKAHGLPDKLREVFAGPCPICGKAYELVGAHIHKSHADLGLANIAQGYAWAKENGDPHGVFAALAARATNVSA